MPHNRPGHDAAAPHGCPEPDALILPCELSAPGATILLGEIHGTCELPAFVVRLVSQLAHERHMIVALEIRPDQVPSLATYLASDGGRPARDAALRDPWWHLASQDGRQSAAMFELIDAMRVLQAGGARIDVVCFDPGVPDGGTAETREDGMARNLLAVRSARPAATLVVLAGNLHTRRVRVPQFGDHDWMAMRLANAGVAFTSLVARYADGSSWLCTGPDPADCGPEHEIGFGDEYRDERGIHVEPTDDGHDGWFGVGPVTASPPAAFPALADALDAKLSAQHDSPIARRIRARRAYHARDYAQCVAELDRIDAASASDAYRQASCLAIMGDNEAAFARLRTAIDRGFRDFEDADNDSDLASLRDDPRWPPWPAR